MSLKNVILLEYDSCEMKLWYKKQNNQLRIFVVFQDNAQQKLRILSNFAKCEQLIRNFQCIAVFYCLLCLQR